jgi:hypothetical protein
LLNGKAIALRAINGGSIPSYKQKKESLVRLKRERKRNATPKGMWPIQVPQE